MDIALATCRELPEPDLDEPLLLTALAEAGLEARVLAWDDPTAPFADASLVVLRSTWNYHHARERFLAWVDSLGPRVHNPASIIRWNTHKRYLSELSTAGLAVVPTELLPRGSTVTLGELLTRRGWREAVLKPAVSAGSFETHRISVRYLSDAEALRARLVARYDLLLQPYLSSVEGRGERAIVLIDGQVTHAVRKSPRFARDVEQVTAALPIDEDEKSLAEQAYAYAAPHAGPPLLYGRVDVARDARDRPCIMELELCEPSLFFAQAPAALSAFVAAVERRLAGCPRR